MSLSRFPLLFAAALTLAGCAAPTPSTCPLVDAADLPVTFSRDHLPVVTVQIAGQNVKMIVDSGAFDSMITPRAYARLNLVGTYDVQGRVSGVTGEMNAGPFIMQTLTLGQLKFRDDVIMVSDFFNSRDQPDFAIDGIIGEDLLQQFNVGWDLPDHKISLYTQSSCAPTETPWAGDYDIEPFTVNAARSPYLPYTIDGQPIQAVLDSGASGTAIQVADLQRAGVSPELVGTPGHAGVQGINGKVKRVKREEFSNASIGAEEFSNIWLTVIDSNDVDRVDSLIGEDFLASHRVFIVNSSRTAFIGLTVPGS